MVEIFPALLGRRQGKLLEGMGRRRLRRHKPKLQVEAMTAARKGESGRENVNSR
jgi:hypothetical protein